MDEFFTKLRLRHELKNQFESMWLRNYYSQTYGINVGLYSYGCFDLTRIPKNTTIGRYCSFANTCHILNGNHGISYISLHPYLYNTTLGLVDNERITRTRLTIEDDVWIGHNAIVLPSVNFIGRGAIIGAGSVVTKNVERYSVVAGNPAKQLRKRFDANVIQNIEDTKWWLKSKDEIARLIKSKQELVFDPQKYFSELDDSLLERSK